MAYGEKKSYVFRLITFRCGNRKISKNALLFMFCSQAGYGVWRTVVCVSPYKIRCGDHKLPIEVGCHRHFPRENIICTKCDLSDVGDEFQFLFD